MFLLCIYLPYSTRSSKKVGNGPLLLYIQSIRRDAGRTAGMDWMTAERVEDLSKNDGNNTDFPKQIWVVSTA